MRDAVETLGKLVFWRVAIKPGRPVAMGVLPGEEHSAAFVGLPGNPVAAFVTFVRVVRPLLLRLAGALPQPLDLAAGARDVQLPQEEGPPRICPRVCDKRVRRRRCSK